MSTGSDWLHMAQYFDHSLLAISQLFTCTTARLHAPASCLRFLADTVMAFYFKICYKLLNNSQAQIKQHSFYLRDTYLWAWKMSVWTFATDYTCIFQWLNSSFQMCVSVYKPPHCSRPLTLSLSPCYKWCLFSFLSKQLHIVNHEACCFNEFIYPCHLRAALIMSLDLARLKQHLPCW